MPTMSAALLLHFFELLLLVGSQLRHHLLARALAQLFEFGFLLICCQRRVVLNCLGLLALVFTNTLQVGFLLWSQVERLCKLLTALATLVVRRLLRCSRVRSVTAVRAACLLRQSC